MRAFCLLIVILFVNIGAVLADDVTFAISAPDSITKGMRFHLIYNLTAKSSVLTTATSCVYNQNARNSSKSIA